MTINFTHYHASDTAPIRTDHLKGFAADSKRSLAARKSFRSRLHCASIRFSWNSIFGRTTLPNSSVSLLLIVGLPLVAQAHA